jgi:hypothetical protein
LEDELDPARGRVRFLDRDATERLIESATSRGYVVLVANVKGATIKDKLLAALGSALKAPVLGMNWDALDEVLTDLSWLPAGGYLLAARNATDFLRSRSESVATLLWLLLTASESWRRRDITFVAVLETAIEGTDMP